MIDVTAIQAAIGSLKTAADIAKAMKGLNDASAVQGEVIKLQSEILSAQTSAISAQSEQSSLLLQIRELQEEVVRIQAWETEKLRYFLTEVGNGTFVYALNEEDSSEPPHKLCANCFNHREKSILQPEKRPVGRSKVLLCHNCGAEIYVEGQRCKEHGQVPRVNLGPRHR